MGFEPMNNGFAIRPLSPLGYAALTMSSGFYHGRRCVQTSHPARDTHRQRRVVKPPRPGASAASSASTANP